MNFAISDVEEATLRLLIYNFECDYWTGKFIEFLHLLVLILLEQREEAQV